MLAECQEVYDALKAKEKELAEEANVQTYPNQLLEEQAMLESLYKQDKDDLVDFLDEHFPAHPVDVTCFISVAFSCSNPYIGCWSFRR